MAIRDAWAAEASGKAMTEKHPATVTGMAKGLAHGNRTQTDAQVAGKERMSLSHNKCIEGGPEGIRHTFIKDDGKKL